MRHVLDILFTIIITAYVILNPKGRRSCPTIAVAAKPTNWAIVVEGVDMFYSGLPARRVCLRGPMVTPTANRLVPINGSALL